MQYSGFDLAGQVALVTGAASGIGRALAIGLAQAGASVAVLDRPTSVDAAQEVKQRIEAAGGVSRVYALDLTEFHRIQPTVDQVVSDFGKLDILVNNAGTSVSKPAVEVTEDEWDRVHNLNLKAVFFCAQAAARHMIGRRYGRIINIASSHALIGVPDLAPYIASKGGVASLTRSLALEWTKFGVNVNAIAPGPVHTPLMQTLDERLGRTDEDIRQDMQRRVPLGRRIQPEELVGAAIFLASAAATVTTGHLLVMDGGQTIH